MKICRTCGLEQPETDFYKRTSGQIDSRCKTCTKKYVRGHRLSNPEYYKNYEQKRARLPHRVAARKEYQENHPHVLRAIKKRWEENHPDKAKAAHTLNAAIRYGKMFKKPCQVCGETRVEAHHEDYNKPLEVVWLCKPHHVEADKKRREKEMAATA